MEKWNYTSERIERRKREESAERLKKAGRILAGILAGVAIVSLFMIEANEDARIVESMKKAEADKMALCLTDWKAGKNGGCQWEEHRTKDGTPYAVEVVAKPAQ